MLKKDMKNEIVFQIGTQRSIDELVNWFIYLKHLKS